MVNAIVADDDKDLCMALANELNVTKEIRILEMINDGTHVIQEIKRLKPEIIILDMKMPGKNGIQIIEDIENDDEIKTKVIVFSGEPSYMIKIRDAKCVIGFIAKGGIYFKELSLKIQEIAKGIGKKSTNKIIMEYLLDLGFSTSNRGTTLLRDCIRLFLLTGQDECKVKELFKSVADLNVVSSYRVKNNVHNSTKTAWNLGNREYIIDKLKLGATEEITPKRVITMSQYYIDID